MLSKMQETATRRSGTAILPDSNQSQNVLGADARPKARRPWLNDIVLLDFHKLCLGLSLTSTASTRDHSPFHASATDESPSLPNRHALDDVAIIQAREIHARISTNATLYLQRLKFRWLFEVEKICRTPQLNHSGSYRPNGFARARNAFRWLAFCSGRECEFAFRVCCADAGIGGGLGKLSKSNRGNVVPCPPNVDEFAEYGASADGGRCGGESSRSIGASAEPDRGEGL